MTASMIPTAAAALQAATLDIEHHRGTALVEKHTDEAIWELMYFGHAGS